MGKRKEMKKGSEDRKLRGKEGKEEKGWKDGRKEI